MLKVSIRVSRQCSFKKCTVTTCCWSRSIKLWQTCRKLSRVWSWWANRSTSCTVLFWKVKCQKYGNKSPTLHWNLLGHGSKTWNSASASWEFGQKQAILNPTGYLDSSSLMVLSLEYCKLTLASIIGQSTCFSSNSTFWTFTMPALLQKCHKKVSTCSASSWRMQAGAALKNASWSLS